MMLLIIEGLFIGTLLGMTGAGGGILAIPILMWSQGWSILEAAPVGLIAITISAFVGTLQGLFEKTVRYKAAIWIAIFSLPSVYIGLKLSHILPILWITILFCLVMLIIGLKPLIFKSKCSSTALCKTNPQTGRFIWNWKTRLSLGGIGILSGVLTGLLGVGGGFVITPSLQMITNLKFYSITNTSLMVIFLIGSITLIMHIVQGYHYPLLETFIFTSTCILGLVIGRLLCKYIPVQIVKTVFSSTLICISLLLAYKTIGYIS
ncbi:sulfite exporter TauE/SafE family protein [Acinetobacter nectaris]|uniref:sulfite exporter TauE/SafE family protein n=1 Tax=Acinetobacter nectaris TaxID=1219382 RepID=UPI001F268BF0|nr:sulfite exporter TauE/SafE family protein [Acinetobacter nectaris]MCF9047190.1 sulfite exporter TauE/SafE family protein [Acinetobacter nectaris]